MATQPNPARKPAIAPQERLVDLSAKNIPRFTDITTDQSNEKPKTRN